MSRSAAWSIELNRRIPSRLKKHGKAVARRIRQALEDLTLHPKKGKSLKKHPKLRSLRVVTPSGEFRVIYRLIEEKQLILIDLIGTREEVYKLLERS